METMQTLGGKGISGGGRDGDERTLVHCTTWCFRFMRAQLHCGKHNHSCFGLRVGRNQVTRRSVSTYNPPTAKMEMSAIF
jgi:hypothetical protein